MLVHEFLFRLFLLAVLTFHNVEGQAQTTRPNDLTSEILHMDSLMFNAFNSRDVETMKNLFDKDLEFYHDISGMMNYEKNMAATKETFAAGTDLHRELVAGSTEVYPIKDYGAMQMGEHTFCHTENGKPDCGTFKFVHIWKKTPDGWKITRVISYGHKN